MRILAFLSIEVTACVTILARITRRPPARGARLHTEREAPKSSKGEMKAGPHAERSRIKAGAIKPERQMLRGPSLAARH